jgi:hypothetical protein
MLICYERYQGFYGMWLGQGACVALGKFFKESKSNSLASYFIFSMLMSYFLHFEANV